MTRTEIMLKIIEELPNMSILSAFMDSAGSADRMANLNYPNNLLNRKDGDAFRHIFWNASLTILKDEFWAKKLTERYEELTPNNNGLDKTMDLKNGEIGRRLGRELLSEFSPLIIRGGDNNDIVYFARESDIRLSEIVKNYVRKGNAFRIDNGILVNTGGPNWNGDIWVPNYMNQIAELEKGDWAGPGYTTAFKQMMRDYSLYSKEELNQAKVNHLSGLIDFKEKFIYISNKLKDKYKEEYRVEISVFIQKLNAEIQPPLNIGEIRAICPTQVKSGVTFLVEGFCQNAHHTAISIDGANWTNHTGVNFSRNVNLTTEGIHVIEIHARNTVDEYYPGTQVKIKRIEVMVTKNPDDKIKLVYYSQEDPRWANKLYTVNDNPKQTIGLSACGPTSMAMIISSIKGINVFPNEIAEYSVKHGFRTVNDGTNHNLFPSAAKNYGLNSELTSNLEYALSEVALRKKMIICGVGKGHLTGGGHIIAIYGSEVIDGQNYFLIMDPNPDNGSYWKNGHDGVVLEDGEKNDGFVKVKATSIYKESGTKNFYIISSIV